MTTEDLSIEMELSQLGRKALDLFPDMFESGINFPVNEDYEKMFLDALDQKAIIQFANSVRDFAVEHRGGESRKRDMNLALRISDHDLNNLAESFFGICSLYSGGGVVKLPENFFMAYTNYRTLVLTLVDLGLRGAPEFVKKLPTSQIGYLLQRDNLDLRVTDLRVTQAAYEPGTGSKMNALCGEMNIPRSDMAVSGGSITVREYVSLYQLVKNVPLPAKSQNVSVEIEISGNNEWDLLVVRDNGPGILDRRGNPISAKRLPEIFGEYSSREGGGLGLQLVKALVELPSTNGNGAEKGYVSVSTKSERGEHLLFYCTSDEVSRTLERELASGTEFRLYFRH